MTYEKQIFNSILHQIRECMFGLFFLTTLDIYKDCFKGCQRLHKLLMHVAKFVHANHEQRQNLP